jgi:hypothetical protein
MEQTTEPSLIRKPAQVFGWLAAWAWTIVAVIGGLGLIITHHKRLVRALLRYLSVSIDSVAAKKKSGHHPVGLDSFCHRLSHYRAGPPGLEDRRARHTPYRPVTVLERRLLLISVARPNAQAISLDLMQLESPADPSPGLRRL